MKSVHFDNPAKRARYILDEICKTNAAYFGMFVSAVNFDAF